MEESQRYADRIVRVKQENGNSVNNARFAVQLGQQFEGQFRNIKFRMDLAPADGLNRPTGNAQAERIGQHGAVPTPHLQISSYQLYDERCPLKDKWRNQTPKTAFFVPLELLQALWTEPSTKLIRDTSVRAQFERGGMGILLQALNDTSINVNNNADIQDIKFRGWGENLKE